MNRTRLPTGDQPAQGRTVYVVDDDASVGRSLRRLLTASEWRVQTFSSAETFLAELEKLPNGFLVIDVQLPGMGGLELLERLQERGISWPAIAMSGSNDANTEHEALRVGACVFLAKPFEPRALLDALEDMAASSEAKKLGTSGR